MSDETTVVQFSKAQEKRQAEEQAVLERLSRTDARINILMGTIEAFRETGSSNEEIVKTLRFAIDVLEGLREMKR